MLRNLARLLLLAAVCLYVTSIQAASKSDPEAPDAPSSLSKLPIEEALPSGIAQENPEEVHPAEHSGQAEAAASMTISFQEAVERTALAPSPAEIQSHIQGEFLQDQPIDPLTRRQPPLNEGLQIELQTPEDGDGFQPLAPGDNVASFDGLANTGWFPPDTVMAVGPNHVAEAVNSGFSVYNKTGGQLQGYTTFASFFAPVLPVGWNGFLFDPRLIYSTNQSRFAMLALGRDSTNQKSYFFLAFSQTSDPTGGWWLYRFDHQSVPAADTDSWADYCGLGADTWGVYVTCNVFTWAGGFKYAKLWSLDTDGFAGGTINGWAFWDLRWNSNAFAFSLQPAHPHSIAADQATFFVNTFSGSGNSALLWKLTGSRISSPTLTRATITTPTYEAIGENVDQPGSTADLDGGDARVMNAVYSNRRVFTVLTHDVDNNGARSGWFTLKLDVDANSLSWSHLLTGNTGFYYFYPAITMEGGVGGASGNLAIFGSWTDSETAVSATTNFASTLFKIYTDQPTNSNGPFLGYQNGLAAYVFRDSANRNRWGDYSGAGFDWSTGNVWGAAEYAGNSNTWRTRITGRQIADGSGCTLDTFEPDDSSGQANTIVTNGTPQTHNICPVGDEDWVSFTLFAESEVTIETAGPAGDTRMWLYDSGLNQLQFDDDGGTGFFSRIDRVCGANALPAGTYFVKVDEFGDDEEIGTYNLAVSATDCPCVPDAFEPDNSSGQANGIGSGSSQAHSICPVGEEDWVTFSLGAESEVVIETSGLSGDTRLWLRNSGLNQIEFNDDSGSGLFSLIDRSCAVDPLPAGTYFVQVDEFGDNDEIGSYQLAYAAVSCCVDDLVFANQVITGTQLFEAGNSVTFGPNLVVNGASIQVRAGATLIFGAGTTIRGTFSAGIDPGLVCP